MPTKAFYAAKHNIYRVCYLKVPLLVSLFSASTEPILKVYCTMNDVSRYGSKSPG